MERYFFDMTENDGIHEDPEGHELADLAAVRRDAVESARELMAADVRRGIPPNGRAFRVRNSRGETVLNLPFRDALSARD